MLTPWRVFSLPYWEIPRFTSSPSSSGRRRTRWRFSIAATDATERGAGEAFFASEKLMASDGPWWVVISVWISLRDQYRKMLPFFLGEVGNNIMTRWWLKFLVCFYFHP